MDTPPKPKIAIFERTYILKTIIFGIYVRFRGGNLCYFTPKKKTESFRPFRGPFPCSICPLDKGVLRLDRQPIAGAGWTKSTRLVNKKDHGYEDLAGGFQGWNKLNVFFYPPTYGAKIPMVFFCG